MFSPSGELCNAVTLFSMESCIHCIRPCFKENLCFFDCSDAYCFQFSKILRQKSGTILHTFQVLNIEIVTFLRYSFTFHCHGVTVHNSLTGQSAFLKTSVLALGFTSLHHVMSL